MIDLTTTARVSICVATEWRSVGCASVISSIIIFASRTRSLAPTASGGKTLGTGTLPQCFRLAAKDTHTRQPDSIPVLRTHHCVIITHTHREHTKPSSTSSSSSASPPSTPPTKNVCSGVTAKPHATQRAQHGSRPHGITASSHATSAPANMNANR